MKINLYKSYNVLGREAQPYYSEFAPASDIFETVTVEIPEICGKNAAGEHLLKLNGKTYLLGELLTNHGEHPALRWYDGSVIVHRRLDELC